MFRIANYAARYAARHWIPAFALCGLTIGCGQIVGSLTAEAREPMKLPVEFRVAESHANLFAPLAGRRSIPRNNLDAAFGAMLEHGDAYCAMLYRQQKFDRTAAAKFIESDRLDAFRASHRSSYVSKLIAGCFNFFIMNDIRPFLDFELARSLYPDFSYDCYSVGFMQPYIMHNILGCDTLQMLDIDWRIHAAHWQLLRMYGEGAFGDRKAALAAIKKLELGWIAFSGPLKRRNAVGLATLCRRNQELCLDHLVRFQAGVRRLDGVRLDLAALHDGEFRISDSSSRGDGESADLKIVYLSNAIEGVYTTRAQFNLLLARVAGSLPENGRAIYIYHAAGTRSLGFYEQRRTDDTVAGYEIKTVCKDEYRRRDANNELESYTTHFERISPTKRPGSCQAALRRAKLI
ncbi:MAG: hypothetical protein NXI24_02660 [bacterium]|nr:hypothetical protein [bacterium]